MNKTETIRSFKTAQEVEQEALVKAQALADATAAEFEELATSMHDMINMMADVLTKIMRHTNTTSETTNKSAILLKETNEKMDQIATQLQFTAESMRSAQISLARRWLGAVAMSAVVGSASASLLSYYFPGLRSQTPAPTITIDTDHLSQRIIERWRQIQQGAVNTH